MSVKERRNSIDANIACFDHNQLKIVLHHSYFSYICTVWGSEIDPFYVYERGQFRFPTLYVFLKFSVIFKKEKKEIMILDY